LRKKQLESEIARTKKTTRIEEVALLEYTRRLNEHYSHRICKDKKKKSIIKINEWEASRKFFKRKSIVSSHVINEEEKTSTIYHTKNLNQLRDWMREDLEIISFMIQKLRKNNDIMINEYNIMIKKHDYLFDLYQALLNKIVN
jgi:hypothetical protein